jgi:methyl-accepting chemotaxis protein
MKTMTIGKKISLACIALVALTIILGTVSIENISHMNTDAHVIVEGPLPGLASLIDLYGCEKDEKAVMLEHIASDTLEQKSKLDAKFADLEAKFQSEMKEYEKTIQTPEGRQMFDKLGPTQERFNRIWTTSVLPLSRANKTREALTAWNGEEVAAASAERHKVFTEIIAFRKTQGSQSGKSAIATGESASFWSMVILALSVVSGGLLGFFIVRGINQVLSRTIAELSEGAEQVSSASGQVSGSSQSLAQGASEQAASLEETSASSEEMSSMTRKNAENSQQAAILMNAVSQRVSEANRTLADMTTSMEEIGASSGKISKIIKVIDEIAFQTNILALNAAVEAARAGEAGMGFAVVADEVRNLAQRSAQAAKDTATLIEDSILKSTEGSKKLGEVASSIQGITEGAGKVKTLVDEVEASSKEQAQGIEQISKAVSQMDEVTQRSAANAEETASASEELSAQSQALMAVVGQLQALVGASSGHSAKSHQTHQRPATRPVVPLQSKHAAHPAMVNARRPAMAGTSARHTPEFPLDDSEFKAF